MLCDSPALGDGDGAMLEPLGVAIHAVDLAHIRPDVSVAVLGCGPIGLLVLQMVRLLGVQKILATEVLPHRRQAEQGSDSKNAGWWNNPRRPWPASNRRTWSSNAPGKTPRWRRRWASSGRAGKSFWSAYRPTTGRRSGCPSRRKGITLLIVRRMKHTYPRAIELVESGRIDVRMLATHRFPLERASEAFAAAVRREVAKVVIEMKPS